MSNLPSFLERGKPIHDKALNFGVMDWGRLEKWQYHRQKQSIVGSNKYSPSTSNSSFLFSTNESSPYSSRSQTHHVSLQSHLNVSPEGISVPRNLEKSQDVRDDRCNSGKKTPNKPRSCKKNDLYFQTSSSSSSSSLKGKTKIQEEVGNFQDSYDPKNKISKSFPFENEVNSERNPIAPEKKESSVSSKNSNSKIEASKQGSISPRHQPSPLRKLLDPFLQSKPTTSGQSALTFEDSKVKAKVKLDFGSCKEVKVGDSRNKMKDSSSTTSTKQALFQMAIKNGRPLFTFTVDNNDDILAATVRSLNEKEDMNTWIYTFFTIHEVKKKKGRWLLHGTKSTNQGYLPNVTAQMKVSNCSVSNCREFVLSSLDPSLPDELAAIVVRFLKNQDSFSMTVVLPGGHHSVPSKGEPSPLIDRWRSGGACDCGGWDIGCRLRTLTNKVEVHNHMTSNKFELFFQGDVINERAFFSISPLKEGIFSVEYNLSLSLLHAFSICISVMECRKSCQDMELKTFVAKEVDDDDDNDDDDDDDDYDDDGGKAHVTYASLPPVSPVGRV
ncbi:hypothetical protein L2E82_20748 [Cichorium intybus]|uniref:Uncharacterized protein n=1 Tax=Cichorium intybus TaxID=13427 RepID=A0ACB9DUZ1_CICIN|nr:hypothetical protein L2E82_20748 [Cichorium intybus]